ncbi:MAG: hypothetical protein EBZ77_02030 [Chitinophagia bacterium]|nr:hypothetical protein [Chitinophagia bacterium]
MSHNIHLTFRLSAPPARVMQLLTDPALIRRWSGGEARFEPKEGGAFMMFDDWATGTVMTANAGELNFSWTTTDWAPSTPASTVRMILTAAEEQGTKVELWHDYIMVFENK